MVKFSEQGISNLALSLAKFQGEVRNPANSAVNPQFRSKYAPLDVVINTVKPILADNGLSFIQSTGSVDESIVITTVLIHESGEYIESDPLVLPAYQLKKGGEKDFNAQGAGSAITYGRRYSLSAILGLSSEDDDDGNNASTGGGYKDASSNPPKSSGGGLSEEEKEKRKQEAIAKAQARQNANKSTSEPDTSSNDNASADKISPQQEKAIGNMLNILARKNGDGFDKDEYLGELVSKYAVNSLSDVSADNAREIITQINNDRAGK